VSDCNARCDLHSPSREANSRTPTNATRHRELPRPLRGALLSSGRPHPAGSSSPRRAVLSRGPSAPAWGVRSAGPAAQRGLPLRPAPNIGSNPRLPHHAHPPGIATLSARARLFSRRVSITLNKPYIPGEPSASSARSGRTESANRLGTLFVAIVVRSDGVRRSPADNRRRWPTRPVARRVERALHASHGHHVCAVNSLRNPAEELGNALAALASTPFRSQTPIGLDKKIERGGDSLARTCDSCRSLTIDWQLIEDDPADEPSTDHMACGRRQPRLDRACPARSVSDHSGPGEKRREPPTTHHRSKPGTVARANRWPQHVRGL